MVDPADVGGMANNRPAPPTTPPRPSQRPEPRRGEDTDIHFTSWDAPLVPSR